MKRRVLHTLFFLFFLFLVIAQFSSVICQKEASRRLLRLDMQEDGFRAMRLSKRSLADLEALRRQTGMELSDLMTVICARQGIRSVPDLRTWRASDFIKWKRLLQADGRESYERVRAAYAAIWDDVRYFPVQAEGIRYENSWMFERNYGGKRGHEGTDLMPSENLSGHYRIVSMTDGQVEQIGWLPKGGFRIGIRSPSGGYYYYAHLDSYSRDFHIGDEVRAGMELGTMGDTGYGPAGTRGKFDVHLHLGIYIRTAQQEELSINPYWVLRYLELSRRSAGESAAMRHRTTKGVIASCSGIC